MKVAVIQGAAVLAKGSIAGGDIVACGAVSHSGVDFSGSIISGCDAVNFQEFNTFIHAFADTYSVMEPVLPTTCDEGECALSPPPSSPSMVESIENVHVYAIDSAQLLTVKKLTITAVLGTLVVVNIPGAIVKVENLQVVLEGGIRSQHVLFNMFEATRVSLSTTSIRVRGPQCDMHVFLLTLFDALDRGRLWR